MKKIFEIDDGTPCSYCGFYGCGQGGERNCDNCKLQINCPSDADDASECEYYKVVFAAVLSTTVLPLDGTYKVATLASCPELSGIPHYIGHPDTKAIVESLGAVQAPTKLFSWLQHGERAICFPIQQGRSSRAIDGFTSPHQAVKLKDLQVRVITRIE